MRQLVAIVERSTLNVGACRRNVHFFQLVAPTERSATQCAYTLGHVDAHERRAAHEMVIAAQAVERLGQGDALQVAAIAKHIAVHRGAC